MMNGHARSEYERLKIDKVYYNKKLRDLVNTKRLTTPRSISSDVLMFADRICPHQSPVSVKVLPEPWSRFQSCNLNVAEYVRLNGGKAICGYKIWIVEKEYIEGERHAVWLGVEYRDLTFNFDGETEIVFVPDVEGKREEFYGNEQKVRRWINSKHEPLVRACNYHESLIDYGKRGDPAEQWRGMLTYQDFLGGRMPVRDKNGQWGTKVLQR